MGKSSNNFELVLAGCAAALSFLFRPVWDALVHSWVMQQLSGFGITEAEVIEKFGAIGTPIFGAISVVMFLHWYVRRDFARRLTEVTSPRIKCSFSMNEAGCFRANSIITFQAVQGGVLKRHQVPCDYYRLRVEAASPTPVTHTSGHLVSIKRDGQIICDGENLQLTFAPAERDDTTSKMLLSGLPVYLDLLATTDEDQVLLTTQNFTYPSSIAYDELFAEHGLYTLHVVVSSPDSIAAAIDIVLNWNGRRATAKMYEAAA
jgi:hypothetical protein